MNGSHKHNNFLINSVGRKAITTCFGPQLAIVRLHALGLSWLSWWLRYCLVGDLVLSVGDKQYVLFRHRTHQPQHPIRSNQAQYCLHLYTNNVKMYEISTVAYPGIFFGGGVQQIQLRTEDREDGDLGAVAP